MPLYPATTPRNPAAELPKTVEIKSVTADLEENGVRLHLTVIDTPGFGDFINNNGSWEPIIREIDQRFDDYLEEENRVNRTAVEDNRIHACLYFIQPTGHSLKALDVAVMKKLHKKVNLIPVIAKADTFTEEEITNFKQCIMADISNQRIDFFEPSIYRRNKTLTEKGSSELVRNIPFAIIGSTESVESPTLNSPIRGRQYPWGVIEVENEEHSDFVKLRQLLVCSHLEDLREKTANVLYENYRTEKLATMGIVQDDSVFREVNPALRQQEERAAHDTRLAKDEAELKTSFQLKVTEKENKLKRSEAELFSRHREIFFLLGHVSVLIGFVFYSLGSIGILKNPRIAQLWYRQIYSSVIITYGIVLYENYGKGRIPNPLDIVKDENIQYLFVSLLWFFTTPFYGTLLPFAIFSVLHTLTYLQNYVLKGTAKGQLHALADRISAFTHTYNQQLMLFTASSEFFVLVRLIVFALSFKSEAIVQLAVYFVFFKLRFNSSQYTQHTVKTWEMRIDGWVSHPALPPVIKQGWVGFKTTIRTFIGPLFKVVDARKTK
ncbi:hypothetical protein DV113_004360 [Geotrichum candidum]|nr:hypothetical protein DV113_004360 [Geotrichum candidum]